MKLQELEKVLEIIGELKSDLQSQKPDFSIEKERLKALPDEIYSSESKLLALKRKLSSIGEAKKQLEKITISTISQEKDSEGNRKFSNQDEREGEMWSRLMNNPDYNSLVEKEGEVYDQMYGEQAVLHCLEKELKTLELFIDLVKVESEVR